MSSHSALELASTEAQLDPRLSNQIIAVDVGGAPYGIPVDALVEVEHVPNVAPVPQSEEWIRGVVNLRGAILTLVDLASLLQIGEWQHTPQSRMLVVGREDPVAIAVDRLRGMRQYSEVVSPEILERMPGRVADYALAVYREGEEFLTVLDMPRVLDDTDQPAGHVHESLTVFGEPSSKDHLPAMERGDS